MSRTQQLKQALKTNKNLTVAQRWDIYKGLQADASSTNWVRALRAAGLV